MKSFRTFPILAVIIIANICIQSACCPTPDPCQKIREELRLLKAKKQAAVTTLDNLDTFPLKTRATIRNEMLNIIMETTPQIVEKERELLKCEGT